jgi:hypothetical protein
MELLKLCINKVKEIVNVGKKVNFDYKDSIEKFSY